MLSKILKYYNKVFIYEENFVNSSLGSKILTYAGENNFNNEFYLYGVPEKFMFTALRDELIKLNGLDEETIYKKIKSVYKK